MGLKSILVQSKKRYNTKSGHQMDQSSDGSISVITNEIRRFSSFLLKRFSRGYSSQFERSKIPLSSISTYKLVMKGSGNDITCIFFICGMNDHVLSSQKHQEGLWAERINHNETKFWERCSFYPVASLWFDGFCAFESVTEASKFIVRGENGLLELKKYDGTMSFKENASFVFRKNKHNGDETRTFENRRRAFSTNTNLDDYEMLGSESNALRKLSLHSSDILEEIFDFDAKQVGKIYQNPHTSTYPFYDYYSIDYQQCDKCFTLKSKGPITIHNSYLTLGSNSQASFSMVDQPSGTIEEEDADEVGEKKRAMTNTF